MIKDDTKYFIEFSENVFNYGENRRELKILHFTILLIAEFITQYPEEFENVKYLIKKWTNLGNS